MESTISTKNQQQLKPSASKKQLISKSSPVNLLNCVFKLTNEANMFAKLLSPKSSKLSRSGLTRRNNSNKRKEDENDLENVTQCRPNEIDVGFNTTETVSVKLTNESSPQETVKNNNNNLININNQRNQHHLHADLSSLSSSSCPSPQSSCTDKRRRRGVVGGGNDNQSQPDQLITGDNLLLPSTHHDNNANQSTNCAQVNEHQQKPIDDQHDNLNSNTMTIDSDNHLSTSSLVNEAYRNECIQLRQRVRELEQQNRLLTLLLAEQLVNSSTNSVDNRSKLDKLMAINSLTNNLPQLISEYESTLLDNNSNHDEVSIMNSSPPGQGHLMNESKGITLTCESDYCGSMGNNHPDHHYHHHIFNNNNNHHDDGDETERSDRLVSMSKDNSMLGFNLTHVNIDRWRKIEEDKSKTKTTTTTQLTSQPNLPITNQLTSHSILPLTPISETINTINLEPLSSSSLSSVSYLDHQKKSSYINNLIENNSTLFTSTLSSSPTTSTLTTTTTITSLPSSSDPFTTTTITPTLTCTPGSTVSTSTLTALNSTLIGSPSSSLSLSPPQSPKKLITSSILDPNSSLFQSSNTVNCSPSLSSSNQLEKRILFILSSNNNNNHNHKYFNSTLSSSLSSSSSSSSSSSTSSSVSTDKINCDNRLINKPGNLALRTLSGSSSKSIVSLEKDSPASSATSFDSNGELTSKDEGYSTMSSDVQSDIGNNNNGSIVTINTTANSQSTTIPSKNESTINSILDDKESVTSSTTTTTNEDNKTNRSFLILTSSPPPSHLTPSRTIKPPPPPPSGSAAGSSLSTLLHLKQQQQLKVETIEIKSEPKKMGVNGSPTNSIPLTFMSTVNPIVVGSSRLTTFKSSHQNDCLVTSSPLTTINNNRKNNKMELVCEKDSDLLIADTIKLNCNNNITTTTGIKNPSQSTVTTIKGDADDKSSNWLHSINNDNKEREENDSQSVNYCKNQIVNCDFIRKSRKSFNGKLSAHRYTFPPVVTRPVANTLDDIEWTPCLIYQPSKPPTDHQGDNLITDKNDRFSNCESSLITTAEKSTSADFDDDESRCLVNNREVIIYQDKRKRSGKNHHHHHMGKVEDDVNLDGKTNQLNQVKCDSVDWRSKIGRRKSAISKGSDCGSLMMKTVKDTTADDEDEYDDSDDGDEEEDEDEGKREKMKRNHKIDQKRKMKVYHKFPPAPESSSSSHGSQSLNRWHSDSQLYSDSMKQDKPPVEMRQVDVNCRSNCRFPRRHRDITNVSHPCQSFASTCKRSSGYIRRRIKREDRARIDESHRWSTLSTSSSALSDGLEAPIYCERRRYRPRLPMTITTTHIDSTGTEIYSQRRKLEQGIQFIQ
ncbi:nuclear pore complex protein DDB_G0274915-like [Panonychus citri]|uniref:nuclear pore complex protein DDB_G0274915-like n=1 Tax=Panonychus citri TaxID=50023 RepID=UPI002307256D|nr:nuclear pore complex protein DDB_G0274915-like [Panonychus citri]